MTDPVTAGSYYVATGPDTYESTPATASPWDDTLQHGGPPAALLARAVERVRPDEAMPIARITVDFLGGIKQGPLRTEARILRPGKRIELVEARLFTGDDLAVTATAWRIRTGAGTTADHVRTADLPPLPDAPPGPAEYFPGVGPEWGYGASIDWRFVSGGYDVRGPAEVWTRVGIPLVEGEEITPTQRLLVVADSTNGLSGELSLDEWWFIPPTVSVTFQRPPTGEWMLLDARTTIGPDGTGLAQGEMYDDRGLVAAVAQPLMVARR